MKFVVLFEDDPSAGTEIRQRHMQDHLSFLERNSAMVDAAGPLKTSSGEGAGGIWIVEAERQDEVERLIKEDPFWPTGLRKSVRILEWTQVFANGRRMISP